MPSSPRAPRILVLGRGRVGGSLARAWRRRGMRVSLAAGRAGPSGLGFDVVVLAVPDGAVADVAARLAASLRSRPLVALCAGALDLSPLEPLRRCGCPVGSLHPLQAIPTPREALFAAAAIDASSPKAARTLAALARRAGLRPLPLPAADRALYHAAAAMASNGLAALGARCADLLVRCGSTEDAAHWAILNLMLSALGRPLTGPVLRGDARAVRAHLAALARRSPSDVALYRALALAQLPLARAQRVASPGQLAQVRAALSSPDTASSPARRRAPRAAPAPRRPRPSRASRAPRSS
ncbi:MAG TPA: DUF2520 domain-containing protein [Myxococcales bacterium]|jgi:predicted short-subunit dehydrogenase-like oxidoreductase (DUF2520 family)